MSTTRANHSSIRGLPGAGPVQDRENRPLWYREDGVGRPRATGNPRPWRWTTEWPLEEYPWFRWADSNPGPLRHSRAPPLRVCYPSVSVRRALEGGDTEHRAIGLVHWVGTDAVADSTLTVSIQMSSSRCSSGLRTERTQACLTVRMEAAVLTVSAAGALGSQAHTAYRVTSLPPTERRTGALLARVVVPFSVGPCGEFVMNS